MKKYIISFDIVTSSAKTVLFHLNFKVANPINAKIIAIIQNLITTVDSAQPFFSKW